MRTTVVSVSILLVALLIGCGGEESPRQLEPDAAPYIVVVNNPLLYFTRRLIGDEVDVRLLAPKDIDPATWQPTVADVMQLQGAELVLLNGAGYSNWLDKVSLSSGKLVVTSEGAKDQWLELPEQVTHSHGPGAEHAHGDYAFTTWMDMSLASLQAEAIAVALQKKWAQRADMIAENLQALTAEIDELDQGYRQQAGRLADRHIIYSHPVYQYFEQRYQLPGHSLHWEPGVMPSDEQWRELQQMVSTSSLFFWEGEPDPAIGQRMAAQGPEYTVLDPAANISQTDWLSVQRENIARLSTLGE